LAAALLAVLVWILRLLAKRLTRVLAGLSGLIALSILLTILVGIILFVITSPQWWGTYDNRAYGGSFRKIKKKAVQFKCGRLLANYRDLCLQLHHEHELHMHGCSLLVVQVEASNFGAWFESLGGTEGGFPFGYRALSLMERK
jgi:hypothetical protein